MSAALISTDSATTANNPKPIISPTSSRRQANNFDYPVTFSRLSSIDIA
jgi:hypothetical protein